jgi:uncharacterized repeat protein (TIGR01451 family)
VEFLLNVESVSNTMARNVRLVDVLPAGLIYLPLSTTIFDATTSDELTTIGLSFGDLAPSQGKVVRFKAEVATSTMFAAGTTVLTNIARVGADGILEITDPAEVVVTLPFVGGATFPTPTPSPSPAATQAGRVLGAAAIETGPGGFSGMVIFSVFTLALMLSTYQIGYRVYWMRQIRLRRMWRA